MASGPVLILALESDLHADAVVHELVKLGVRVVRIDPTVDRSLPKNVRVLYEDGAEADYEFAPGERLRFAEVAGILCRFAVDRLVPAGEDPLRQFSRSEEIAAFLAPLRMTDRQRWINDPWCEGRADCRILQAHQARKVGLRVPPFVVSSRYSDLVEFSAERRDGSIIKPISDAALARVNGSYVEPGKLDTDRFLAPYAAVFEPLPMEDVPGIDMTPSMVQARVRKKLDVRATVIDGEVFSAAMPVGANAPLDFRISRDIQVEPFELPEDVNRSLVSLVAALELRFASCDLLVDVDGGIHFLEANVSGNWLWTELGADLPIAKSIAEALLRPALQDYAVPPFGRSGALIQ
jgi:hypothetical protein